MKDTTKKLCESAIMVALATALSFVVLWKMPLGGSTKLCAMLPILLIGIKNGPVWGFGTAFGFAAIQLLLSLGDVLSWGLTPAAVICTALVDYLLAYTALGIVSLFCRGAEWKRYLGITLAVLARFACHVFTGVVVFDIWMPEEWANPFWYSICYNGAFLLPELGLTLLCAFFLLRVPSVKKLLGRA